MSKYRFKRDDDCNWYLLPLSKMELFNQLLENGEEDCYAEFISEFDQHRIDSPEYFVFENPNELLMVMLNLNEQEEFK